MIETPIISGLMRKKCTVYWSEFVETDTVCIDGGTRSLYCGEKAFEAYKVTFGVVTPCTSFTIDDDLYQAIEDSARERSKH